MVNARQKDEANRRELIAGISHDLCTPLTAINTYVEGIELGMASTPEKLSHYLSTIKSKASDLNHIINQLFLFSKLDVGEFPMQAREADIGLWLSDFVKSVSDEYEQKGLQIDLTENVQGAVVRVDDVQFRNVLSNIFENTIKHGNIEQGVMRITCRTDAANVTITLSDNGSGVSVDETEKLFEVFYRGDKARSNTSHNSGLGLAISAKIIERLNGTIKAVASPEGGLAVIITLPIYGGEL
jgi:signal transduction histidine kinase